MFELSGVNYEEVLEQGDSILVRVIASSSYRGFELPGLYCIYIWHHWSLSMSLPTTGLPATGPPNYSHHAITSAFDNTANRNAYAIVTLELKCLRCQNVSGVKMFKVSKCLRWQNV